MIKLGRFRGAAALGASALALLASAPLSAQDRGCDRACMAGLLTDYIAAVVAHDPAGLPLADGLRVTEDSRVIALGEGVWPSVTGMGTFRQDYIDAVAQIAATQVELRDGADRLLYSAVLHLDGASITGIETLVQRITPESRFQPSELGRPIRGMNDPVAPAVRETRASLIAAALTYTNGLRIGNFTDAGVPFADNAYRVENGVITAGEGCFIADCGLTSQRIMVHPGIIASVAAVDEEAGNVLLWMNFGFTDSYGPGNALVTFEGFKIWGDQIHAINAFFVPLPISTPRAWPSLDRSTARE